MTSRLSLPSRLKYNNGASSNPPSLPTSRNTSPRRNMSENAKPGLVLRVNVLKVRPRVPRRYWSS